MICKQKQHIHYQIKTKSANKVKRTKRSAKSLTVRQIKGMQMISENGNEHLRMTVDENMDKKLRKERYENKFENCEENGQLEEGRREKKKNEKSKNCQRVNSRNIKKVSKKMSKDKIKSGNLKRKKGVKENTFQIQNLKQHQLKKSKSLTDLELKFHQHQKLSADDCSENEDSCFRESQYFVLPLYSKPLQDLNKSKSKINRQKSISLNGSHSGNNSNTSSKRKSEKQTNQDIRTKFNEEPLFPTISQLRTYHQEIQEEQIKARKFIFSQEIVKERGECLNVLSKICSSMNLSRQTYALAICYMDNFIDIKTELKTIKIIAITSLVMAIKSNLADKNEARQLSSHNSLKSLKSLSISSSFEGEENLNPERKKNSKCSEQKTPKNIKESFRICGPNVLMAVLSHQQIFSEYDRILSKQEIIDMEMQMSLKMSEKHLMRHYIYWIGNLTEMWDSIICETHPQLKKKVTFQYNICPTNVCYLIQFVQLLYYFPYAQYYSKVILVLSIMYILVRVRASFSNSEGEGFEYFRKKLHKSSSLIFTDKTGINEVFGQYLDYLQLEMKSILDCCQYVSQYLSTKVVKDLCSKLGQLDYFESNHHYNPEIFRYFQLKCLGKGPRKH